MPLSEEKSNTDQGPRGPLDSASVLVSAITAPTAALDIEGSRRYARVRATSVGTPVRPLASICGVTPLTPARRRPVALLVAAASAGLLLPGCSFLSPDTSLKPFAPADGLQAELGDVLVRNMLVVSEGDGEPGLLVGALVNRGEEDTTVSLEVGETAVDIDVPAGVSVAIGTEADRPDGEQSTIVSETVEIDAVEPAAGDVVELTVTDAQAGSAALQVQVVLPTKWYADLDTDS